VRFLLDENTSSVVVEVLRKLGQTNVDHILDHFPVGTKDPEWIPAVARKGFLIVTQDKALVRNPAEVAAIYQYRLGGFILDATGLAAFQIAAQIIMHWPVLIEHGKHPRPFMYSTPPRGFADKLKSVLPPAPPKGHNRKRQQ
jgi:hypothetical protein